MSVLVGRSAPDFTAAAVLGTGEIVDSFTLSEVIKGKKAVVFFYPLDFTFVCPTEIIAFSKKMDEFKELMMNLLYSISSVIYYSTDLSFCHFL